VIGGFLNSSPHWVPKLQAQSKAALVRGIVKLKGEFNPGVHLPGAPEPPGLGYKIYQLAHGNVLQANDVEALFDIAPQHAAYIAQKLESNPALKNTLVESDWWVSLRAMASSPNLRGDLLKDLADDVNFANALKAKPAAEQAGLVGAWEVLYASGKIAAARNINCLRLFDKLDVSDLSVLRTNLLSSLDDVKLVEFGDDFGETIMETLQRMNNDISIFNYWKAHKQELLTPYVTNTGNIPSMEVVASSFQGSPQITALINVVDAAPLPSGNQFVMAGCQHPSLPNSYQIKYNFTSAGAEYQAFLNSCHPLLKDRIKYMDMIRNDFVAVPPGTAYARLVNIDNLNKLRDAGEAGRHAELQSLSETLYQIEQAENMAPGTFPKSRLSEVSIFVKNRNGNVMQRCPCCFHGSHDHSVNMVNLPGND
jgi:hypothetical protein